MATTGRFMPSLASVTFDASGFAFDGESDGARVWYTPAGDGLGVWYFALKPDVDADVRSIEKVRRAVRSRVTSRGAAIVEVETTTTDGCLALRQIIKVPQQPHGMTYIGSLLLPFRDFSFVVKVQCEERGTTGVREAIVLAEAMSDGRVTFDPKRKEALKGWMQDPYDPALPSGFHRNLAEAPEYDLSFPDHPLSRLRPVLAHLELTLRVTKEVRESPPYVYSG
jgi:hypothetical protein